MPRTPEFPEYEYIGQEADEEDIVIEEDEEEDYEKKIAELEQKARERQKRMEQKARTRQLKKQIRKLKTTETIADIGESVEPLVTVGKKALTIAKETGSGLMRMGKAMSSKREVSSSVSQRPDENTSKMELNFGEKVETNVAEGKRGLQLGLSSKREMGSVVGSKNKVNLSFGKKVDLGQVIGGKNKNKYDFSLGKKKKGGIF